MMSLGVVSGLVPRCVPRQPHVEESSTFSLLLSRAAQGSRGEVIVNALACRSQRQLAQACSAISKHML
jgi:hypothetical protein